MSGPVTIGRESPFHRILSPAGCLLKCIHTHLCCLPDRRGARKLGIGKGSLALVELGAVVAKDL